MSSEELDTLTEVYMNLHGEDLHDDELWESERSVVAGLVAEGLWPDA